MRYFATTPKGLEPVLARELTALGAAEIKADRGGVHFSGDLALGLRANLWLRSAMRVLEVVAERLPAGDAAELYEAARALRWHERLGPKQTIAVEAHGKTRGLIHTHFTALKIKDAIVDEIRDAVGSRPSVDPREPDVRVMAHLRDERATLYLDLSGESLHRRGYRFVQTEAPLKEALAAGILLWAGWSGQKPLADPMCGSGTFSIEAALLALGRAPNLARRFGVERWPSFGAAEAKVLKELRAQARGAERAEVELLASDVSARSLDAARANAKAAGVYSSIRFAQRDVRQLAPLSPPGLIVMNPPYGERIGGEPPELLALYRELGAQLRTLGKHEAVILSGNPRLGRLLKMFPKEEIKVYNGPIECSLSRYEIWDLPRR